MKLSEVKGSDRVERDGEFSSIAVMPRWRIGALLPIIGTDQIAMLSKGNFRGCVITTKDLLPKVPVNIGAIVSEHPVEALYDIHNALVKGSVFYAPTPENQIDGSADIHPTAIIASKGVRIGKDCIIGPKASILEGSIIEKNVIIGPGTVIGSEDPLLFRKGSGSERVLSAGGVLLREDVEIHANCNISRGIFGDSTVIGAGVKFDNLVCIGQNTKIGDRSFLAACASIGSDVVMGKEVWIGPNSTVSSGVTIGDNGYVTIGAVVVEDVRPNQKVTGNYAIDHDRFIEFLKKIR